jgi:hypothetical protein
VADYHLHSDAARFQDCPHGNRGRDGAVVSVPDGRWKSTEFTPLIATANPKPPVTWIVKLEMSQAEVDAWKLFAYRLRDGVVVTGITGHDAEVLNNTFSPLYEVLESAEGY